MDLQLRENYENEGLLLTYDPFYIFCHPLHFQQHLQLNCEHDLNVDPDGHDYVNAGACDDVPDCDDFDLPSDQTQILRMDQALQRILEIFPWGP